jgi:two-component system cell cycle response regulator DivK
MLPLASLSVGRANDKKGERSSFPPDRAIARPARAQASILVVDDVEDTRLLYQRFFEWQGMRVISASDGVAALQAVLWERPDVVVLDLAMPKMTGWEVLESLRADRRTRDIPVIVVSGQGEHDQAMLKGADSYCSKPCLPDALLREVQRVLRDAGRRL